MAKRNEQKAAKGSGTNQLLNAAREHQDALALPSSTIELYQMALQRLSKKDDAPNPAAQTLMRDIRNEAGEVQAAIRKDFPGNESFQAIFQANEPQPTAARKILALGRLIAKEAPDFSQNLIRHALNQSTVNHLKFLCDQLEKELGGADPTVEVKAFEDQIREAAQRAFEGKPELAAFSSK